MKEPLSYTKEQIEKAKYDVRKNMGKGEQIKSLGEFVSTMSTPSLEFFLLADDSKQEGLDWIISTAYNIYAQELGVDINIIPKEDIVLKEALVNLFCTAIIVEKIKRMEDVEIGAENMTYLELLHKEIGEITEKERSHG